MCQRIRCSRTWRRGCRLGARTVELPAGRYETIMPPSTVADLMIYLTWTMGGRGAQEGRTALAAPGGGTRIGEKLTSLPLTLYSDPARAGVECAPFVAASSSSERCRSSTTGWTIGRVDWIRDGVDQCAGVSAGGGGGVRRAGGRAGRQPADDRRVGEPRRT